MMEQRIQNISAQKVASASCSLSQILFFTVPIPVNHASKIIQQMLKELK